VVIANRQHLDTMSKLPLLNEDEALKNHLEHDVIC
jgi:hypothetical protein